MQYNYTDRCLLRFIYCLLSKDLISLTHFEAELKSWKDKNVVETSYFLKNNIKEDKRRTNIT
jgi:hypothetical protein